MATIKWHREIIKTNQGERTAIAPIVISASRATDIPAFFSDWFLYRLKAGYAKWINPFNQKEQYVSFSKAHVFVFWTKNAQPFFSVIDELNKRGVGYYFQYTINDYEKEKIEPRIPMLSDRIETFIKLSNLIGRNRVIWRFDPLILTDELSVEKILKKIESVGRHLHGYTNKLVVSLADIQAYGSVSRRLKEANINWRNFNEQEINYLCKNLLDLSQKWGIEVTTCCESIALKSMGLNPNSCIDPVLIAELFGHDPEIRKLLKMDAPIDLFSETQDLNIDFLKDSGQRLECGCMVAKDIGSYNTCLHECTYCYANHGGLTSKRRKVDSFAESLVDGGV